MLRRLVGDDHDPRPGRLGSDELQALQSAPVREEPLAVAHDNWMNHERKFIKEGVVQQGEPRKAELVLHADMPSYLGLLAGQLQPEVAICEGRIRIEGDPGALHRFLAICGLPGVHPESSSTTCNSHPVT